MGVARSRSISFSASIVLTALAALGCGSSVEGGSARPSSGESRNQDAGDPSGGGTAVGAPNWGPDGAGSGDSYSEPAPIIVADPLAPDPADEGSWAWFQLSPDDSTSMATAQLLKADRIIHGLPLRAHEIINYYDPPPSYRTENTFSRSWQLSGDMSIAIDGSRSGDVEAGAHGLELLIHAYAPLPPASERRPYTLHLCVDVSGSMAGERLQFTKDALHRLVDAMQAGDRVSLTTFESRAELVHGTLEASENRDLLHSGIDGLVASGGTNMLAGLELAYGEAQRVLDGSSLHRVLLFSDGAANVGDTDIEHFAELTRSQFGEGIYLSGIGVGNNYDFQRMNALTDAGRGAHVFLPSADEVGVIFGTMLRKIIEVAADEVSIEVELPRGFELQRFSGEESSTNPDERVQNIVLAAGDDFTLLADFSTEDETLFEQDMILTFAYTPLGGEPQLFKEQFSLADLFENTSALAERTRLLRRYGEIGLDGFSDAAGACALQSEILAFEPMDAGLGEVAGILAARAPCP